jgi:hypothetical protein
MFRTILLTWAVTAVSIAAGNRPVGIAIEPTGALGLTGPAMPSTGGSPVDSAFSETRNECRSSREWNCFSRLK